MEVTIFYIWGVFIWYVCLYMQWHDESNLYLELHKAQSYLFIGTQYMGIEASTSCSGVCDYAYKHSQSKIISHRLNNLYVTS